MIEQDAVEEYLKRSLKAVRLLDFYPLGAGVHGTGFLVNVETEEGKKAYVLKDLTPHDLGHDYPSDRAGVCLLALDEYNNLPNHARAIDVLAVSNNGSIRSIGGGNEYYLLMEKAEGRDYFKDLAGFSHKERLDDLDVKKIKAMASYLGLIHAEKRDSRSLYWRKIRDIIGHGECLMGVFDLYPDGTLSYEEMAEIEKSCIDWRARLKSMTHRLSQIHGDFHPGNIWFKADGRDTDFVLLDRSRGAWGEPADDITALAINYIFFSLRYHVNVTGAYLEGINLFFEEYIKASKDRELFEVLAPFFAFRGAVVANPLFYPDLSLEARSRIFNFVKNVLLTDKFEVDKVNDYIASPKI
ncbi:aminoglycoside phosphotransferase family protein [Thermodesulfovibrionales bacterium]|nr:aminoglycoside phosphotransferase family protein [Thermodesulfovibrionales bacterium]MCL0066800.1 aminoglycoside phosphotransferase family protein [Thermodesulfovibrionales bacterium]MCL0068148.1 aminoglycoside phosphotransferase family protein [Thermodesulfovibrionales bacterium]MCL0084960.1 aminoglycoside phosphotransferase family protein [Thermodesulfovibrionales bacterium]MCL0086816.1 aminoglycoside phosphotransferase family protein [Thermodesulfovibrionales bacterium]